MTIQSYPSSIEEGALKQEKQQQQQNQVANSDDTEVMLSSSSSSYVQQQQLLPCTDMLYMTYDGNFLTDCYSTILEITPVMNDTNTTTTTTTTTSNNTNITILDSHTNNDEYTIVLDRTVLHAQGGGQPTDIGQMMVLKNQNTNTAMNDSNITNSILNIVPPSSNVSSSMIIFNIHKVLLDRSTGIAKHYATIQNTNSSNNNITSVQQNDETNDEHDVHDSTTNIEIQMGDMVHIQMDIPRRQILSECHTAGHVVDAAMMKCGYMDEYIRPSKGYHFLDSPYVEYIILNTTTTSIWNERLLNKDDMIHKLQVAFNELINDNIETKIELLSKEEANIVCNGNHKTFDIDAFTMNDDNNNNDNHNNTVRVVTVAGYPCPCGGTHVHHTGILRTNQWYICGMKCKKNMIRIKYGTKSVNHHSS